MNAICPESDTLRRYAIGDLDDSDGQEIEAHLADCPVCEETVAQFDSADDTLMRHLPLVAAVAEAGNEPGWLDRLRDGPPAGEASQLAAHIRSEPDDAGTDDSIGQFSAYELLGVLGRGGMGVVYRARHRHLNRPVALKVLSPRLTTAAEARRRFEREIHVLGGLHHPGIVMATDAGRAGGAAYLVMELVDGIDLSRLVRQGGPLSVAEACEVARQMADALAAAHQAETVHRDVKPSNVMVDRRGRVKLLDFGLAHLSILSNDSFETSLGRLLGTLDYMAPEQAVDQDRLDFRADIYSLGATLFYLLMGQPPHGSHTGRSLVGQLRALASAEAPRAS
jgi:serine/threonine protein kinase